NVGALDTDCKTPGMGVWIDTYDAYAADEYVFTNSIFWGNAPEKDFVTSCEKGCSAIKVSVSHSLLSKAFTQDGGIRIHLGPGNIDPIDPRFVAPGQADFRLKPGSPAIGRASDGTNLGAYGVTAAVAASQASAPEQARKVEKAPPAVGRGSTFLGFPEKFNRYYTDPSWKPSRTLYVSPDGGGDGAARDTPMAAADAVAAARPGTKIHFLRGRYTGCFEVTARNSGTYDEPVLLYGERNDDGSIGVSVSCCGEKRKTCFNLEAANYVAIDGFEMAGGNYGVRAVGAGFPASQHSRGVAVLNCNGHDQDRDPIFSGHSDWAVWEGNVAYGAKEGDGHGIYLSNGGDWNIVRFNETYGNVSSDFQINADPASTCAEVGIPFSDPRCDAYAGEGEGGQGASDYMLVENNYFHDSLGPGPNFTSVRRSVIRNNIFGPQARHNVSFWQETDNPKLGSSDNKILHNLFITRDRHAVQFVNGSTRNEFANNLLVGIGTKGGQASPNPKALLMEVDDTVGENAYRGNVYVSGHLRGRKPNDKEWVLPEFSAGWFANFPSGLGHDPNAFTPAAAAPFLGLGTLSSDAPADRNGTVRRAKVNPGPIESP
ncbi:MAG: right-handed parallel beta-helix repeat-containing protein, partial [Pseudorhodoplanes sp.]